MSLNDVHRIASTLENEYVKRWRENGGRVIGYACIAFPKEIAEAGRILPFRLRGAGNSDTSTADSYLSRYNCSVCRSCLELVLNGSYDFLNGYVRVRGCDHWMGTFDEIKHAKNPEFMHYLKVPHIVSDDTLRFFSDEIKRLKEAFESYFGIEISEEEVVRYAVLQDEINEKLRDFYSKRFEKPEFYGSDAIALMVAKDSLPSEIFLKLLDSAMNEKREVSYRAKVLLSGCPMDEIELVKRIEEMGALVVSETTCFGGGAFWNMIKYDGSNIYEFLAKKYLENLKICARMFGEYEFRKKFVVEMAKLAGVDGVILQHNKFCDLSGIENAKMRIDLENKGIPTLVLEKEYASTADIGRIKTRVQAFLERMKK